MRNRVLAALSVVSLVLCGCGRSTPATGPAVPNAIPGAPSSGPSAAPTPQPAPAGQISLDLQDRSAAEASLKKVLDRWKEIVGQTNVLGKQEQLELLRRELEGLNAQYKGKAVRWKFPTRILADPPGLEVRAPGDFLLSTPGVNYAVSTGEHIDDLRGDILIGATKDPVPPRLVAGQGISREEYGKVKDGQECLVEGTLQELRFPSVDAMRLSLLIDVYICRARITAGPF